MKGLILALPVVALAIVKETGPHDAVRMNTGFEVDSHTASLMDRVEEEEEGDWNWKDFMVPYLLVYANNTEQPLTNGNIYIDNKFGGKGGKALYLWELTNLQKEKGDDCSGGAGLAKNSCGVHVHRLPTDDQVKKIQPGFTDFSWTTACERCFIGGTDCKHFYSAPVTKDPWTHIDYTSTGMNATGEKEVDTGRESILGQVMVVHNYDGSRRFCGPIQAYKVPLQVKKWVAYPGENQHRFRIQGKLNIEFDWNPFKEERCGDESCNLLYSWYLWGKSLGETQTIGPDKWSCSDGPAPCGKFGTSVEAGTCDENKFVKNSCGLHVHQGTQCEVADGVGGHYYNRDIGMVDPWLPVRFVNGFHGRHFFGGKERVNTKAGPVYGNIKTREPNTPAKLGQNNIPCENCGRVAVLHYPNGGRMACGVIEKGPFSSFQRSSMRLESDTMMTQRMDEMERRIAMMEVERK